MYGLPLDHPPNNHLERHFEPSFEDLCFEALAALVESQADLIEVRRRAEGHWEASVWVEQFPGTTWPLALFQARGSTAATALLAAWKRVPPESRKGPRNPEALREA